MKAVAAIIKISSEIFCLYFFKYFCIIAHKRWGYMRYIDFDGVILDTEALLFYEWRKNPNRHKLPESEKIKYIQESDWHRIINESPIINDSIYILKQMDPNESAILTKVHSLSNEGYEKVIYLRNKGILQNIILVPYNIRKSDIVIPEGDTLIDDSLRNLSEWEAKGGYPMFFDKKENNIDSWNMPNDKGYQRVLRIDAKRYR